MRHKKRGRKFGRNTAHRKSLIMNLAKSLVMHERIETTEAKAKDIRPIVEKLVTRGRDASLHSRRETLSFFQGDQVATKKLFELSVKYATRPGGYLSITKTFFRQGDAAPMAIIRFVPQEAIVVAV